MAATTNCFQVFIPAIADEIKKELIRVVREFISTPANIIRAFEMTSKNLCTPQTLRLAHEVMYALAVFVTWKQISHVELDTAPAATPSLQSVLENNELWTALLIWPWNQLGASNISSLIIRVCTLFSKINDDLLNGDIELQLLHVILKNADIFMEFHHTALGITRAGSAIVSIEVIESSGTALKAFDKTFEELQTYASLFCSWYVYQNTL